MIQYEVQYIKVQTVISEAQRLFVLTKHKPVNQLKNVENDNEVRNGLAEGCDEISPKKIIKQGLQKKSSFDACVKIFRDKIQCGPVYVCVTCNRCLYKKSVKKLLKHKYTTLVTIT